MRYQMRLYPERYAMHGKGAGVKTDFLGEVDLLSVVLRDSRSSDIVSLRRLRCYELPPERLTRVGMSEDFEGG